MKYIGLATLIFIGGFILWGLGIAIGIFSLPFHAASNLVDTAHGVIDKTLNADNAIYNYEWFKQQVEDIKAWQKKTDIAHQAVLDFETSAGSREKWTFEDKTEDARLRAIEQGLKSQTEDLIATYNARSKEANRNIFENGLIPNTLEFGSSFLH